MYADLHCHSNYSDGGDSPKELIKLASEKGIKVLSLTDHDTVQGVPEITKLAEKKGIHIIPGVELSTSIDGIRLHILGYHMDLHKASFQSYLDEKGAATTENTKAILRGLNRQNKLNYTWEQVMLHHKGKKWICSSHVYDAMRQDGHYEGYESWIPFYYAYFSRESSAYVDMPSFSAKSAIEAIVDAGGVPVIAHPKRIGDDGYIEQLIKWGAQGIEVMYPYHNRKEREKYKDIAIENNLFITGGSDWHGVYHEWDEQMGDCGLNKEEYMNFERNANRRCLND